jgi:HlyD family secretion protein
MKTWLLVLLLLLTGCQPAKPGTTSSVAALAVVIIQPEVRTIQKIVEQPGRIEGYEHTPLFSKLPGYIKKWSADIGDVVKSGQVLAELYIPEIEEELKQKEAAVGLATAQVEQARKSFIAAKANVEKADAAIRQAEASKTRAVANLVRWRSELARQKNLVGGAIAPSEFEMTTDAFRASEAAVAEAEASIDLSRAARSATVADADKAEAQVTVALAQQQLSEADRRRVAALLNYTKIVAPFNGIVTRRQIDTGHFVQAPSGTTATSVQPLFHVVRTDLVRIYVDVPEVDACYVEKGIPVSIRVQSLQNKELSAPVARVSWALDTLTRTLRAEVDLPNPEGLLRPGMYVTARITISREKALSVPATAVGLQQDQPFVVMVEDGKAKRVRVQLGLRTKANVELLQQWGGSDWKPIDTTMKLVASGVGALENGQSLAEKK